MPNPGITELQNEEQFELLAELNHKQIKEFVMDQLSGGSWLVKSFMVYQVLMLTLGAFIIIRSVIFAFNHLLSPLYYVLAALAFSLTVLIVIHELLHGIAIKCTGAKKVNYGAYLRKFIFYAEADRHVLNKKQFAFIALSPFIVVKISTLLPGIFFFNHPSVYFMALVMCTHSLFCAGDIGLLSLFYQDKDCEIYTFDVKDEKKSYYYKRQKKGSFYKLPQSHENN